MVQIIAGEKGKGKTKYLLEKVNAAVQAANGNMYELSNKVRLVNVTDFPITNYSEFMGFICGIVSQDHDLEELYLDSFLTIANMKEEDISHAIEKLDIISEKYHVKIVLSVSVDKEKLPECAKAKVIISL